LKQGRRYQKFVELLLASKYIFSQCY